MCQKIRVSKNFMLKVVKSRDSVGFFGHIVLKNFVEEAICAVF